ncbi:acetylxylan esterase [Cellulomonas pakistanensis]|uniref:Acetylxylan esterase n=1 Tax=Cellulomonas pakistanensis TaxID=992287 RepID=A0A919P6Y8_9CELL|nr:acetylxylan esterase [Cellulomonas pakistanensis]GIG35445.1 acetylxylan esterase [Cellulomonas pakistanensis]
MFQDLPEPALWEHASALAEPADLDAFWARTLAESRAHDAPPALVPEPTPLTTLDVWDVTFPGFGGDPVRAWYRRPAGVEGPLPVVVQYVGYGGGRGAPTENLLWASAGFAHLQMDTRGQGSGWSRGDTPDPWGTGPQAPGVMTRGIEDPGTYYYRRLLTDAVRAVDAARALPGVDPDRVAVVGGSQGAAMAIAAGALADVAAVVADVPFLCDVARAVGITDSKPYAEVVEYLAVHRGAEERVLRTLSYVDGVGLARRGRAPARFSVALMDVVVPPSTVVAAHRAWGGPKELRVWRYNGHESGGPEQDREAVAFVARELGAAPH